MTEAEFEQTILPCYRKMYAAAYVILSDSSEASDAVQESFSRLWERRDRIAMPDSPEAYCLTVVRRLSIDRIRRRRALSSLDEGFEVAVAAETTGARVEDADALRHVSSLLASLPESQQRVIKMSSILGMDNREIATATGLSDVNVRTLLSRGRRRLKQLFENNNK